LPTEIKKEEKKYLLERDIKKDPEREGDKRKVYGCVGVNSGEGGGRG